MVGVDRPPGGAAGGGQDGGRGAITERAQNANANATAQSSMGKRSHFSGRPKVATAGAISETLVVQDTKPPNSSSTIDSTVIRKKFSRPPKPSCTEPIVTSGLPPAKAAVIPPTSASTHSQTGIDGRTARGTRAIRQATKISRATSPMGTQPG